MTLATPVREYLPDGTPVLRRIELLPGPQSEFVRSQDRFPALFSGVGGGKTFASCVKAYQYAFEHKGSLGCLTAPTYRAVEDVTLTTWYDIFGEGLDTHWEFRKNEMAIRLANGSKILLRPAEDPDKLRGLNLAFFGMDEAAIGWQHETFKVLQARLRQPGYPHQGWITTTPKGIRSWLYQRWVKKELDGRELPAHQYVRMQARTKDNTHLDDDYLESLQQSYGDTKFAAQELEGEFVAFDGQAFPEFSPADHVQRPPVGMRFKRQICGLDFGFRAPLAVIEASLDERNHIWVTKEFYKRRCDEREMLTALGDFAPRVFCDPSAKDTIDYLRREGVQARKAKSNDFKLRGRLVGARLAKDPGTGKPGMSISPECPNLIEELSSLAYAKQKNEAENEKWEPGLGDHAFDALAYALMELDAGARGPRPILGHLPRRWGH